MKLRTPDPVPSEALRVERAFNCRCVMLPMTASQMMRFRHEDGRVREVSRRELAAGYAHLMEGDVVHTGDEKKTPSTGEWSEVGAHLVGARVTAPRAELLRRKLPEIR